MGSIYLGIEDNKILQSVQITLEKHFPNINIKTLSSENEIRSVLNDSKSIIIVSQTFIQEIMDIQNLDCKASIYILDNSAGIMKVINDQVRIVNLNLLLNELQKFKDNKRIEEKPNSFHVDNQSNLNNTNSFPIKKDNVKKTKKDVSENKNITIKNISVPLDEANFSSPVILDKYPEDIIDDKKDGYSKVKDTINLHYKYDKLSYNKIIGCWSFFPNHREVLHIIVNLAIFLAQDKEYILDVGVIETKTEFPRLGLLLTRYKSKPELWYPVMTPVFFPDENYDPQYAKWHYRGVDWHPMTRKIANKEWTERDVHTYLSILRNCNIGFVDLQFGKLPKYHKYTLDILEELWIFIDNDFNELFAYIDVIEDIKINFPKLKLGLVLYNCYKSAKAEKIAEEVGIPLIFKVPNITDEIERNSESNVPIINNKDTLEKIYESFFEARNHLINNERYKSKSIWHRIAHFFK